jgi:sulfate adenylyltransferase subunit 1 (EFTu-like GTPase family)
MSVTLVLEDDIDISRGDMLVAGPVQVGQRFDADIVWMDERPLDPKRMYLLKHTTRVVTAEVDRTLALNEIGSAAVTTSRPLIFDKYRDNRSTGSFILIDPATNFTAGAGMIGEPRREREGFGREGAAERLARLARGAATDDEAIDAIRAALDELLS